MRRSHKRIFITLIAVNVLIILSMTAWLAGVLSGSSGPEQEQPQSVSYQDNKLSPSGLPVQFSPASQVTTPYEPSAEELENSFIYQTVNEAVVNITSISTSYNHFMQPVPSEGTGSGSIIDGTGLVLTNYHVVERADELSIRLSDGTEYDGKVMGIDPENDIALVRFDPRGKPLTTIPVGSSTDLFVGQKVLAIGNPFGLDRTLTTGIISALGRPIETSNGIILQEMIQTDASINPGNSGGPLINTRGEMIGMNTMIYSTSGGSVGIGFAVPIDSILQVIPELLEYGKVLRGWIDFTPVQLFPQLARYADLPVDKGLLVSKVESGSLADKAGLRGGERALRYGRRTIYLGGDIIVEVDETEVKSIGDLYNALVDNKPGETINVKIMRGKSEVTIPVTLSERPTA